MLDRRPNRRFCRQPNKQLGALTLAPIILLMLICFPLPAAAVELNELLISRENDDLRGIILVGDLKRSNRNIRVLLPEQPVYRTFNIDYSNLLRDLSAEFNRINSKNGRITIVFPYEPVDSFDLLVEISWDTGKLLRRYAVSLRGLLPDASGNVVVRISPLEVDAGNDGSDVSTAANPAANPAANKGKEQKVEEINSAIQKVSVETVEGDSWRNVAVAMRQAYLRDEPLNEEQIMLALRDKNPNAFVDGRSLRIGIALALPDYYEISEKNKAEAQRIIHAMFRRTYYRPRLEIATAGQPDVIVAAQPAISVEESQLLEQSESQSAEVGAREVVTLEEIDKEQRAEGEASGRLSLIRRQLEQVEKLITLKSVRLISLQDEITENKIQTDAPTAETNTSLCNGKPCTTRELTALLEQRLQVLKQEIRANPLFWSILGFATLTVFILLLFFYARIKLLRVPRSRAAIMRNLRKGSAAPSISANRALIFEGDDFPISKGEDATSPLPDFTNPSAQTARTGRVGRVGRVEKKRTSESRKTADATSASRRNIPSTDNFLQDNLVNANLDLARAYINMGESSRARSMLEDVINNGSSEEQKKARQLIAQIK